MSLHQNTRRVTIVACAFLLATSTAVHAQAAKPRPASPINTAIAHFNADRLPQAKAAFTPLAKAGNHQAMYYLGRIAIDQDDGDEAVDWLKKAVKENDRSSLYHQWLASAYGTKAGSSMMAAMAAAPTIKRETERAIELDPSNIEARILLTNYLLQAPAAMGGGIDKAREQIALITTRNPYQGKLVNASFASSQKDTASARKALRELITAFPDSAAPTTQLASSYANTKQYDEAFRVLEARIKRKPNDNNALYQLARIGALSGTNLDRSLQAIDRFLKLPRKHGDSPVAGAHWRRGMILEAKGNKVAARAEYESALRIDPKLEGAKTSLDKLK
jgi:tetratricopeptide (TPR) repeat protein